MSSLKTWKPEKVLNAMRQLSLGWIRLTETFNIKQQQLSEDSHELQL